MATISSRSPTGVGLPPLKPTIRPKGPSYKDALVKVLQDWRITIPVIALGTAGIIISRVGTNHYILSPLPLSSAEDSYTAQIAASTYRVAINLFSAVTILIGTGLMSVSLGTAASFVKNEKYHKEARDTALYVLNHYLNGMIKRGTTYTDRLTSACPIEAEMKKFLLQKFQELDRLYEAFGADSSATVISGAFGAKITEIENGLSEIQSYLRSPEYLQAKLLPQTSLIMDQKQEMVEEINNAIAFLNPQDPHASEALQYLNQQLALLESSCARHLQAPTNHVKQSQFYRCVGEISTTLLKIKLNQRLMFTG